MCSENPEQQMKTNTKPLFYTSSILLFLSAFFLSWGAGLQNVTNFNLSKLFVIFSILLITYWLIFSSKKFKSFPCFYNYFIIYIILHTIITYMIFVPEELGFGYLGESAARAKGFVVKHESNNIQIIRMFLYIFFAYAVASFVKNRQRLVIVAIAYGAGLLLSSSLGTYHHLNHAGSISQFAGGFLNPNFYGVTAMTSFWLNFYVAVTCKNKLWLKVLAIVLACLSVYYLFLSISRGPILALCVGITVMLFFIPGMKKKIQIIIIGLLICLILVLSISKELSDDLYGRINLSNIQESRGSYRLDIWSEYLSVYDKYILSGVGMKRSETVIKDISKLSKLKDTHNTYLETIVEFGIVGISLFLLALCQFWRRLKSFHNYCGKNGDAVFLGFFTSWCVAFMFNTQFGNRSFWLSLAVIAAYITLRKKVIQTERFVRLNKIELIN